MFEVPRTGAVEIAIRVSAAADSVRNFSVFDPGGWDGGVGNFSNSIRGAGGGRPEISR